MYGINLRPWKYFPYQLQTALKAASSIVSQPQIKEPPSLRAMATFSLCVAALWVEVCLDLFPSSPITRLSICNNNTTGQEAMCTSTICIDSRLEPL